MVAMAVLASWAWISSSSEACAPGVRGCSVGRCGCWSWAAQHAQSTTIRMKIFRIITENNTIIAQSSRPLARRLGGLYIGKPKPQGRHGMPKDTGDELMRILPRILLFSLLATSVFAAEGNYLYRAQLVQATPGKFVELLDLLGRESAVIASGADPAPFIMRHSQGDHWDLMLIYPMASYAEYYRPERIANRKRLETSP